MSPTNNPGLDFVFIFFHGDHNVELYEIQKSKYKKKWNDVPTELIISCFPDDDDDDSGVGGGGTLYEFFGYIFFVSIKDNDDLLSLTHFCFVFFALPCLPKCLSQRFFCSFVRLLLSWWRKCDSFLLFSFSGSFFFLFVVGLT